MAKFTPDVDVDELISQMDLDEKVSLLTGAGSSAMTGLERLGIPALMTSDGPHGLRGFRTFDSRPSCLLPCATGMGATFDVELLGKVGGLLGEEARAKHVHIVLAPTICLQRSPLIGRGFEAFGEDPVLSGLLGASYVNGLQKHGVAACIKHYAAHDQSRDSIEDNVCMTERTLRELHALPFQLAFAKSQPWSIMSAYHKINGLHVSEDPLMLKKILREEWGFDGLVMSDWWGTYSTSEAINAGMDLEMPGPTVWRGKALSWAVQSRKVSKTTIDESVRAVLKLAQKVTKVESPYDPAAANTEANRRLVRQVAAESIVLLKNERNVLPLNQKDGKTYGLIGDHFMEPALCGGGSSEVEPYYAVTPYDAMVEAVGAQKIAYATGCYSFRFTPLLKNVLAPNTRSKGFLVEIFGQNPKERSEVEPVIRLNTPKDFIDVPESLHGQIPTHYFVRAKTTWTPKKSGRFCFGFSVAGKGRLYLNDSEIIDLWTKQPVKTHDTPLYNRLSMEDFATIGVVAGETYSLEMILTNEKLGHAVGTAVTLSARLGGYEIIDENQAILEAIELAKRVDIPIVMTGLSLDYEYEGADRTTLALPGRIDDLIAGVLAANPNTIIVTQSGCPIEMPWISNTNTLLHAWFGGQETGHGLTDVLFGHVNPSGRLSLTFPKSLNQTPAFLTFGKVDRDIIYGEGVFIGHRYYERLEQEPLFFFGYGLSYSNFEYSNLKAPSSFDGEANHIMDISVDIKNVGLFDGAEVVQVYIQDIESSLQRPVKELKAFRKVRLIKDEQKTVRITLDKYALSFWSQEASKWIAEAGDFNILIATSADPEDLKLHTTFTLPRTFYWLGL